MPRSIDHWLIRLCDPEATDVKLPTKLGPSQWRELFALANQHAVTGAVLRNVRGCEGIPTDALQAAEQELRGDTVVSMVNRQMRRQVTDALAERGIPSLVIKGESFADALYAEPSLRSFRDVDLLVPVEQLQPAAEVMRQLGFEQLHDTSRYGGQFYGQQEWQSTDGYKTSVEVHWNIVNSPRLRQHGGLTWEHLHRGAEGLSPAGMLLVAAVHAAVGHQFDRLQQLCDVRQVCRGRGGEIDYGWLRDLARRSKTQKPLAWTLAVAARVFGCEHCRAALRELGGGRASYASRWLINRAMIVRPAARWSKLRRIAVREQLKKVA